MGCKRVYTLLGVVYASVSALEQGACMLALGPGWDNVNESIEYELAGYQRRATAVKWFSFAICLTAFVVYGIVAG